MNEWVSERMLWARTSSLSASWLVPRQNASQPHPFACPRWPPGGSWSLNSGFICSPPLPLPLDFSLPAVSLAQDCLTFSVKSGPGDFVWAVEAGSVSAWSLASFSPKKGTHFFPEATDTRHWAAPRSLSAASRMSGHRDLKIFCLHFCPASASLCLRDV